MLALAVVFAMAVLIGAIPISLVEARADTGDAVPEFSCPPAPEEGRLAYGQGYWWFASPGEGIYRLGDHPASGYSNGPEPDGSQINMGAYGNTLVATTGLEALLDEIRAEVSRLRELNFLEEVDCQFITRDELREWLLDDLESDFAMNGADLLGPEDRAHPSAPQFFQKLVFVSNHSAGSEILVRRVKGLGLVSLGQWAPVERRTTPFADGLPVRIFQLTFRASHAVASLRLETGIPFRAGSSAGM